jgi:hypothetical protein
MNFSPIASVCALTLLASPLSAKNHFVAEVAGGLSNQSALDATISGGSSMQLTLGVGGRLRGLAPAFYGIARIGMAGMTAQGAPRHGLPTTNIIDSHWAIGGRIYVPIVPRLRLLGQAAVGMTAMQVSTKIGGRPMFKGVVEHLALFPSIGLQYRATGHISVGISTEWTLYPADNPNDFLASTISAHSKDSGGPDSGHVTFAVHF